MPPATKREVAGSLTYRDSGPKRLLAPVDQLPELLPGLEVGDPLCGHQHPGPRLGVAAGAAVPAADAEAAEAAQLDLLALVQGVDDRGEHGVHDDLGVLAREV